MKLVKGDLVNNILPIVVKFDDGEDCMIPPMCMFSVAEIKGNELVVAFVIPKCDIILNVNSLHFILNTFAMRN